MRRISQVWALCFAGVALTACSLDEVTETKSVPTAGVRFINALPDTQAVDFRFVDRVENSAHWGIAFRNNPVTTSCVTGSTQIQYKNTQAGERRYRVFLNDTVQAIASTVVRDGVTTFAPDQLYTVLLSGRARTGSTPPLRLDIIHDAPPDPGAQVALRFINASSVAVDVRHYVASAAVPAVATWTNVAPLSVTSYVLAAPGQIRFNVRPTGGGIILADALALPGVAGSVGIDPLPGTTLAGSAVTGIFFDPPVSGSKAPQGSAFRTTTGSTTLYATDTTFARTSGSFIADCFFVGQRVSATGFSAANSGAAEITALRPQQTTGSTSLSATATGYSRAAGSFITNGFVVGQQITASGFATAENNGRSVITAVTATDLTVTKATPTVAEAASTGRTVIADAEIVVSRSTPLVPQASAASRTIAGERLLSFMWDRRPPRS